MFAAVACCAVPLCADPYQPWTVAICCPLSHAGTSFRLHPARLALDLTPDTAVYSYPLLIHGLGSAWYWSYFRLYLYYACTVPMPIPPTLYYAYTSIRSVLRQPQCALYALQPMPGRRGSLAPLLIMASHGSCWSPLPVPIHTVPMPVPIPVRSISEPPQCTYCYVSIWRTSIIYAPYQWLSLSCLFSEFVLVQFQEFLKFV
jgi:hypothetical protein